MKKTIFVDYLKKIRPDSWQKMLIKFEAYHNFLLETNKVINLISRKSNPDDWWTTHYLDSILIDDVFTFSKGKLLDFGTGGGLPGVPLAIINPTLKVYLMDATLKKVNTINNAASVLQMPQIKAFQGRLEEIKTYRKYFDFLVCRSVKIKPEYKKPLTNLVKKGGKLFFYKAVDVTDMQQFKNKKTHNLSCNDLENRLIIEVKN